MSVISDWAKWGNTLWTQERAWSEELAATKR